MENIHHRIVINWKFKKNSENNYNRLRRPCRTYPEKLVSEFSELEKAMPDRHQWTRMVNNYHGTRRHDD